MHGAETIGLAGWRGKVAVSGIGTVVAGANKVFELLVTRSGMIVLMLGATLRGEWKRRSGGAWLLAGLTLFILVLHPVKFCIGCEGPDPLNRGVRNLELDDLVFEWLAFVPFLTGVLALHRGYLVLIGSVLSICITQRIDVVAQETAIFQIPVALVSYAGGRLVHAAGLLCYRFCQRLCGKKESGE